MKRANHRVWPLMLAAMLIFLSQLAAQSPSRYTIQPGSRLWMAGSSNIRDWTAEASELDGFVEIALPATEANSEDLNLSGDAIDNLPRVELSIPVAGLKSGHKIMDKKIAAALKAKSQPVIHYELLKANVVGQWPGDSSVFDLWTLGKLKVAGMERLIETLVAVQFLADGQLLITGTLGLKMSDFGVEAPKALVGLLVTDDDIEIHFSLGMVVEPGLESLLRRAWVLTALN